MSAWYRRWPFVSGVVLILLTNAIVLGRVLDNRRGPPESTLTLTDRELSSAYGYWRTREDNSLALRLQWRLEPPEEEKATGRVWFGQQTDWLDGAKLESLGIHVRPRSPRNAQEPSYSRSLPADVLLVLQMNGAAYERQRDRACRRAASSPDDKAAREDCEREKHQASRLFVIDAGLDREALRAKYPDRMQHAIVRGQIEAARVPVDPGHRVVGYVRQVAVDELHVPASMRSRLDPDEAVRAMGLRTRSLQATVAFGRRLEPWIASLTLEPLRRE